jgi:hypothetical protein
VWDAQGNPLIATLCSTLRHHLPQADQVSYEPGFDATSCLHPNFNPTGTTVVINGSPYYYVSTDPVTGNELVNNNYAGFLVSP